MKIATGVRYLRSDARTRHQERNWHVYVDGAYARFSADTLDAVRCFYADCWLEGLQGNTVSFRTHR